MSSTYRGGNSRLLAKSFDELGRPLAILDWQGEILFVNAALCGLVKVDSTQLVGKRCSWEIAADESPHAALLTALAPPAGALEGNFVGRQLTAPIVYGSTATGQLFIPVRDASKTLAMVVVILGDWEEIKSQLPQLRQTSPLVRRSADEILVRLRNQWSSLDSLLPLFGESPAIQLAMQRSISNSIGFQSLGHGSAIRRQKRCRARCVRWPLETPECAKGCWAVFSG